MNNFSVGKEDGQDLRKHIALLLLQAEGRQSKHLSMWQNSPAGAYMSPDYVANVLRYWPPLPLPFCPCVCSTHFYHFLDGWWCTEVGKHRLWLVWEPPPQRDYLVTACVWWSSVCSLESVINQVKGNISWLYLGKRTGSYTSKRIVSTVPVDKEENLGIPNANYLT